MRQLIVERSLPTRRVSEGERKRREASSAASGREDVSTGLNRSVTLDHDEFRSGNRCRRWFQVNSLCVLGELPLNLIERRIENASDRGLLKFDRHQLIETRIVLDY